MGVWFLWIWVVGKISCTHLIRVEQISLTLTTPLVSLQEPLYLSTPLPLLANHRYAFVLELPLARVYLGASNANLGQCALSTNTSWVTYQNTFDFFAQLNSNGPSTMLPALAVQLPTFNTLAFGQTFTSGSETNLTVITLLLGVGMTNANAVNASLRIYDVESWNHAENIVFPYLQESNSPTPHPVNTSTLSPTPYYPNATFAFKTYPNCPNAWFPKDMAYLNITCETYDVGIPFVSESVAISRLDTYRTNASHYPFPTPVLLLLTYTRHELLTDPAVVDGTYVVACAWFDVASTDWSSEGVTLLGNTTGEGQVCVTTHFTTFGLVLRRTSCLVCRTIPQLLCLSVSFLVAILCLARVVREAWVSRRCRWSTRVIFYATLCLASVAIGSVAMAFPKLAPSHPGVLLILSSLVSLVELASYMSLIQICLFRNDVRGVRDSAVTYRVKCVFVGMYGVMALGIVTLPIVLWLGGGEASWARGGAYFMCGLTAMACLVLGSSSCIVACYKRRQQSFWTYYCTHITLRFRFGSVLLASLLLLQALLWILSIRESVLESPLMSQGVEDGFHAAALTTFLTLLFLFGFGLMQDDTALDSAKHATTTMMAHSVDATMRSTETLHSVEDKSAHTLTDDISSRRASVEMQLPQQAFYGAREPPHFVFTTMSATPSAVTPSNEPRSFLLPGADLNAPTSPPTSSDQPGLTRPNSIIVHEVNYYDVNELKSMC